MEQDQKNNFLSGITGISRFSIIALIVVLLLAVFIVFKNEAEAPTSPEENDDEEELVDEENEETEDDTALDNKIDSLVVEDQEAGDSVTVSEMDLTENRWVVIHEDLEGEPGNILGARLFFEDDTEGVVNLLRETEEGGKYYAILYMVAEREKDKDRVFDNERDLPLVKEDNGDMVTVPFTVN